MSQFFTPVVKITIIILILALLGALAFAFIGREQIGNWDNYYRSASQLLSKTGTLHKATSYVATPNLPNGSIANLQHFLSKNPGRNKFIKLSDRRIAQGYLEPLDSNIQSYKKMYKGYDSAWTSDFLAKNRALFELVKQDVVNIAGIPIDLLTMEHPPTTRPPAYIVLEEAIGQFGKKWAPFNETRNSYKINKLQVREYLLKRRAFKSELKRYDNYWKNLIASLYNLSIDSSWQVAVSFDKRLKEELDELILIALTGDFYRRGRDLLSQIPETENLVGGGPAKGIIWNPQFSYYKNVEEITGTTTGTEQQIFVIRASFGYTFRDLISQTWLNSHKDWIADYLKTFFSNISSRQINATNQGGGSVALWRLSRLKADIIHPLNKHIVAEQMFGTKKLFGIRDLAFTRIQLLTSN